MATAETRHAFEQLLKQAGKNGKKMTGKKENEIVENLERSLTKDDPLLENNTFDGEADKNLKNLRNSDMGKGKENKDSEMRIKVAKHVHNHKVRQLVTSERAKARKSPSPSSGKFLSKIKKGREQAFGGAKEPPLSDFSDTMKDETADMFHEQLQKIIDDKYENEREISKSNSSSPRIDHHQSSVRFKMPPKQSQSTLMDDKSDTSTSAIKSHFSKQQLEDSFHVLPTTKVATDVSHERQTRSKRSPRKKAVGKHANRMQSRKKMHRTSHAVDTLRHQITHAMATSSTDNLFPSQQLDRPIKITVEDVDSLSNVFKVIWERHSRTIVKKREKLHAKNMNEMSKSESILTDIGGHKNVQAITQESDTCLSKYRLVSRSRSETGPTDLVIVGAQSEPDIYKTVWSCLSREFFGKSEKMPASEPQLKSIWRRPDNEDLDRSGGNLQSVMLASSFEAVEQVLMEEESDSFDSSLVETTEDRRVRFWINFWKRNGVEFSFEHGFLDSLEESYINGVNDKDVPKKIPREKRKKAKLKANQPDDAIELLPLKTETPTKTPRKKPKNETTDDKESPRPIPTPRKLPEVTKSEDDETTIQKTPQTAERKKRRTKKRNTPRAQPLQESVQEAVDGQEVQEESAQEIAVDAPLQEPAVQSPSTWEDDGTILGVTVHHCDHLRADLRYVAHPVVRVSVVNPMTGNYLGKQDSSRRVSSFYESESVSCMMPLMTQPFDFKTHRSILPRWEEMLVFNEPFQRLTFNSPDPAASKPILFFVIRDFVAMAKVNNRRDGGEKGWHNVAWAFLKLISANGQPNAGRKMRLQLFYPPRGKRAAAQVSSIEPAHDWWLNHPRQRYPSTLYVTVKPVISPNELARSSRSMLPTQPEEAALTFNELNQSLEQAESEAKKRQEEDDLAAMQQWSRLPGQTCKIPNAPLLRLWAGSEGAFTLQFSNRGTRLAVASAHEDTYPILLYSIPSGEDIGVITGHQQLVYDLQWSKNDRYLLSASADGTAQVWDIKNHEKPIQTLPHPCYVYTVAFHPIAQHLIVSGGYDTTIRVWNTASITTQLTQELTDHKAIINSIIFDQTGLNMYSADGLGTIICWSCPAYEKAKKNVKTNWSLKAKIEDRELTGICINCLRLHPHNNKIVVHCRDSTVRILDARIHSMKKLLGLINHRQLLRSSVTPCGTFVFSGSEDGCVYVWNVDTGDQVAVYNELGFTSAVHAVAYHPHDHMVAFCTYTPNQSILIYKFNSAVATMEAGFQGFETLDGTFEGKRDDGLPSIGAHIEASKAAVKLERIKHQLDSVLGDQGSDESLLGTFTRNDLYGNMDQAESLDLSGTSLRPPLSRNQDGQVITPVRSPRSHSPYGRQDSSYGPLSTWGSTFDSSTQSGMLLQPSYMSPHASAEARAMAQQYARSGRMDPGMGLRPNVAAVGGSPYRQGIPPDVSFSLDETGKQRLNVSSSAGAKQQSIAVALFDYQANRSDELSIVRGDIIKVLFKDSANWWFGERTSDKKQGYFPSNYVEEQVCTASITNPDPQPPMFGVPQTATNKKVHALKMPGGRLQFYSQSESEGDDERLSNTSINSSRRRRREAKVLQESLRMPTETMSKEVLPEAPEATFPKSILQKTSPRPKVTVQAPSAEGLNIKEVSFADQKEEKDKEQTKQKLIESINAVLESSGVDVPPEESRQTSETHAAPSPALRRTKSKPKASPRSKSSTSPRSSPNLSRTGSKLRPKSSKDASQSSHAETSFGGTPEPHPGKPESASSPSLNILRSVQALMNKKESDSTFSQSVLGGHDIGTPKAQQRRDFTAPVHSTAMKKPKYPVENVDDSGSPGGSEGSVIRKARPLPKIHKFVDEEAIPMVEMKGSKKGRSSPMGQTNPAFDSSA